MAIVYQVYSNDGKGGPVDYANPISTVSGTTYTTGSLSASGDYRFAVRAMDTTTGLLEANTQASIRLRLDASGNEVGQVPNAPFAPIARLSPNGGCLFAWSYFATGQAVAPTTFLVFLTSGATASLVAPVANVSYQPGVLSYSTQLNGLSDGATYTVSVVSQAAAGTMSAAVSTLVIGDSTPPLDVEGLSALAVP
jgi:hypothetical protein